MGCVRWQFVTITNHKVYKKTIREKGKKKHILNIFCIMESGVNANCMMRKQNFPCKQVICKQKQK